MCIRDRYNKCKYKYHKFPAIGYPMFYSSYSYFYMEYDKNSGKVKENQSNDKYSMVCNTSDSNGDSAHAGEWFSMGI